MSQNKRLANLFSPFTRSRPGRASRRLRRAMAGSVAAGGMLAGLAAPALAASGVEPLYYFPGAPDGASPDGGVTRTATGIMYGSTFYGGPYVNPANATPFNYGVIYQLAPPSPQRTGSTESVLYAFQGGADGFNPSGNLAMDQTGNLFGTTVRGGPMPTSPGTVFELSPPFGGQTGWVKTTLHTFGATGDVGKFPTGSLVMDATGALYGATFTNIFKLTPPPPGQWAWTYASLFATSPGTAGPSNLLGGLVMDSAGALYGTSAAGGSHSCTVPSTGAVPPVPVTCGTVFKLSPPGAGSSAWTETTLYEFAGTADGGMPSGRLYLDAAGNLYGTTQSFNTGTSVSAPATVFMLSPPAAGQTSWTKTTLWSLPPELGIVSSGVTIDSGSILGAATMAGGTGTEFFKLTSTGVPGVAWTETTLTQTPSSVAVGDMTLDAPDHLLFGTMQQGPTGGGVVFSLATGQ